MEKGIIRKLINLNEELHLLKNSTLLMLIKVFNFSSSAFVFALVGRNLSLNDLGVFAIFESVIILALIIIDYGFYLYGPSEAAKRKKNLKSISNLFYEIILSKIVIALLCSIFLIILINLNLKSLSNFELDRIKYWFLFFLFGAALNPFWFFQGIEQYKLVTVLTVIFKVIYSVLVFFAISNEQDIYFVINIYLLSHSLFYFILFTLSYASWPQLLPHINIVKQIPASLIKTFSYFWGSLISYILNSTQIFGAALYLNAEQLGYYAVADKVIKYILLTVSPVMQALLPKMSALIQQDDCIYLKTFLKYLVLTLIVSIILALFIYFNSDFIIKIFLDTESDVPSTVLSLGSLTIILVVTSNFIVNANIVPANLKWEFGASITLSACIYLIMLNVFSSNFNVFSPLIAWTTGEFFATTMLAIVSFLYFKRKS